VLILLIFHFENQSDLVTDVDTSNCEQANSISIDVPQHVDGRDEHLLIPLLSDGEFPVLSVLQGVRNTEFWHSRTT
jgi:hypothetical protein